MVDVPVLPASLVASGWQEAGGGGLGCLGNPAASEMAILDPVFSIRNLMPMFLVSHRVNGG